jgi:hypothetical protein
VIFDIIIAILLLVATIGGWRSGAIAMLLALVVLVLAGMGASVGGVERDGACSACRSYTKNRPDVGAACYWIYYYIYRTGIPRWLDTACVFAKTRNPAGI